MLLHEKNCDPHNMSDLIYVMAFNIEESLVEGGAQPGIDYTKKDLFAWAMPFALHIFSTRHSQVEFTVPSAG